MRFILLAASALTLSACSSYDMFGAGFGHQNNHHAASAHQGHYGAPASDRYASGPSYNHHAQSGYAYSGQTPSYAAPVHVYPTGQASHYNGGGTPALRGLSRVNSGPRYYSNLGAVMYDVDDEAYGVVGRLGVQNGILGAELEGTVGLIDDTRTGRFIANGVDSEAKVSAGVQWSTAAFATARMPVANRLDAFGRVGYHITELEGKASVNGQRILSDRVHSDGFAYGAGLEYAVDPRRALRLDYTRYESDDLRTADSISASFVSRF